MPKNQIQDLFESHKELTLFGRYIHLDMIEPILDKEGFKGSVDLIGHSVNNLPIYSITMGKGNKKVLIWSQMHGNESTTTKALFDFLNLLSNDLHSSILTNCTLKIIPILNPDGAKAYTRLNANQVDLNRDAIDLSQPESQVLRTLFDDFKPDYCFNLHGQRTIYSAGAIANPATISFLSPAQDEGRTLSKNRKIAMEVIVAMNNALQEVIPGQVGRYDDGFNLNCVGDRFQSFNIPTILFEAGHYPNDYHRERTRGLIFMSLKVALEFIAINEAHGENYQDYFQIPENQKLFFDVLIKNSALGDIGILYDEQLVDEQVIFVPKVEKISNLSTHFGHKEINANDSEVFAQIDQPVLVGNEIDFVSIKNEKFSLKLKKN